MGGASPSASRANPVAAGPIFSVMGLSLTLGAPSGGGTQTPERGTRGVRLPLPPGRLSQDSNIFSTYFTDGTVRLRYTPEA